MSVAAQLRVVSSVLGKQVDQKTLLDAVPQQSLDDAQADSILISRREFEYDEGGSVKEAVFYAAGAMISRFVLGGSFRGPETEVVETETGEASKMRARYSREFDVHGNWIKQTKSAWSPNSNEIAPIETTYREITYY